MKNKTRGAVTIFLVVILVPCILVSSIFVDLSRVKLAQGAAESAADLALNTLLSQFDTDLNDWYGLVASCQNVEEFYEVSAQQFYKIVSSQGVTAEEMGLTAEAYSAATGDDTIHNFLKLESLDQSVSAVPNANLKDPMIIKEQVVEFMKYRAPIEMGRGLLERLMKTKDDNSAALEEADANEELVEAKQEYYNAESGWLRNAFATYQALMVYYRNIDQDTYYDSATEISLAELDTWAEFIYDTRDTYEVIHQNLILNLFTANNPETGYKVSGISMRPANWELKLTESTLQEEIDKAKLEILKKLKEEDVVRCDAAEGATPTLADYSICSPDDIEDLHKAAQEAVSAFREALVSIKNATEELVNKYNAEGNTMTQVQVWVALSKKINTSNVFSKWNAVVKSYEYLTAVETLDIHSEGCSQDEVALWCGLDTQGKLKWHAKVAIKETLETMKELEKVCFVDGYTGNTSIAEAKHYRLLRNIITDLQTNNASKVDPDTLMVSYGGTTKSVSYVLRNTSDVLSKYHEILTARIAELEKILNGEEGTDNVGLDKLQEAAAALYQAYTEWNNTVNNTDTEMAEEDKQELNEGYTVQGENNEEISYQSVKEFVELINDPAKYDELRDRVTKIKEQMQSVVYALESLTVYGGTPIKDIPDYKTLRKLAAADGIKEDKITLYNAQNDEYAKTSFKEIFDVTKEEQAKIMIIHDCLAMDAYKYEPRMYPDAARCNKSDIRTPELFVMLHKRWNGTNNPTPEEQNAAAEAEQQVNDAQADAEGNSSDNPDESVNEAPDGVGGDITATIADGEEFSAFDTLTGLWGLITNLFGNMDEIRDDIYVTTYMMEMFSYATYENEGKFNLLSPSQQESINAMNYTQTGYYGGTEDAWKSTALTTGYNKSLTGKMINSTNNHAYLAELEYILYGKTTSKANISAAKTSIYGIRYLLNTISCFQYHWRNAIISSVASMLSAATYGIIPAPLIKVVILLLYSALETGVDIKRLSCGFKVALYKTKDDWAIPIDVDGIFAGLTGEESSFGSDKNGLFYSDYLLLFVFSGLSKGGNMERSMLLRMAEVIQANMRKLPGNENFDLGKSHTYFRLEATLRVKPMLVSLPIFEGYDRDGMLVATDWCTFDVSMVRGYS